MDATGPWLTPSRALLIAFAVEMSSPWQRPEPAKLTVGVQSEPLGGLLASMRVQVRVDGAVVDEETIRPAKGTHVAFPQPWEKTFEAPTSERTAKVDVTVEGLPAEGPPMLTRLASTRFVPGTPELLRVQLESRCVVYPVSPNAGKVPGPLSGPTCTPPSTCIQGACRSDWVPPDALETYAIDWPNNAPDRCKPRNAGPPVLQVGTGQTEYLPLATGQTLQAEAGPQGGHHIWIATRVKNMKQRLTTTRIEGVQPGTGTAIPPSTFVFTYVPDAGGYCKLYGLRYQLDNGGIDYKQFLGKPLDVTVTVTDPGGTTTHATTRIQVAPTLLH
jgi:hypothetical protein